MSRRAQVIGLALLAVLTGVLVLVALGRARPAPAVPVTPLPWPTDAATTVAGSPGPSVSAPPSATPEPSVSAPPSAAPSASPQPTETRSPLPDGLAGLYALIERDGPGSVLVFGDGSGDEPDEWVRRWAVDHLGTERPVSYRSWDRDGEAWRKASPNGGVDAITVWNASRRSPDLAAEPARVAKASRRADVVLLSYGHRKTPDEIAGALTAIHAAVLEENPDATVVVLLQNPDPAERQWQQLDTVQEVKRWARAAGLDTVDIYDAFLADPTPRADLVEADGSPTATGSALWARTLHAAIRSAAR